MERGQAPGGGVLPDLGCHAPIPYFFIILSTGRAGPKQGPLGSDRIRLLGWGCAQRKKSVTGFH